MTTAFKKYLILFIILTLMGCNGQTPTKTHTVQNEILSANFDQDMPFAYKMPSHLSSSNTSPGWSQKGQKIMLTGIVYERDGKTPAANAILYYYHTDTRGIYATNTNEPLNMPKNKLGQTHGYIRGWVKTGVDGSYSIKTVLPGSYPNRNEPAHIHISVKDNQMEAPYYLDDFVFDHDPLLTSKRREQLENRGGSGIIRFVKQGNLWVGERNIILGLHIPDYPIKPTICSGKPVGEDLSSFTPFHAYGPDKGSTTCPICKYGWYQGILYFVGNQPDWDAIKTWLLFLERESQKRAPYLKVYFVYGNANQYTKVSRQSVLEELGKSLQLEHIALTFVPSFSDQVSNIYLNQIRADVENTFIVYRRSHIVGNFCNLQPNTKNFSMLQDILNQGHNTYFKLPRAKKE